MEYHAAYYRDPETGWYSAKVLDFPGAISQGRTLESASRNLRDALEELAKHLLASGEPLPTPNPRARDRKADREEPIRLVVREICKQLGIAAPV